jgi:hypothetical protein
MVSATKGMWRLVQTSDGKPIKIKYQPEAYFQISKDICILADMLLLD